METADETQLDPSFASSLLLEIAQERSLDQLLHKLIQRVLARPQVARFRVWMIRKGDICSTCVRRQDCPDQTKCLHAVAGGSRLIGTANDEVEYIQMTDRFARIPLGAGVVGKIGLSGQQMILRDLDQDPGELTHI